MKRTIVSGFYNPIHIGHINNIREAKKLGDYLIVIVNNDEQQHIKKGKVIMDQNERMAIVETIRYVDEVILAVDKDPSVSKTLEKIRDMYPEDELMFCNGGDRVDMASIPESKLDIGLKFQFNVGGGKQNSSTNINQKTGRE